MKRIKIKIENFIYEHITKWYVKLTNKRNHNLDIIKGNNYDYFVNDKFKGCKYSLLSPIECIYFTLIKIYRRTPLLNIQGITMDYSNDDFIKVNITTERPGLIIGKGGKDIDNLTENLTEYFGKKVNVNLIEIKTNFIYVLS